MTHALNYNIETDRYAKCIEVSKRVRWDIEQDVIRGRKFDMDKKFLPDGLSLVDKMDFLSTDEQRFLSQIQGRTYANVFGLVERFICAKVMDKSQDHVLGDQVALEALVRFSDEELKHQEMFRRLDEMAAAQMPAGYEFQPQANDVAKVVLSMSDWSVLGLTLHIELFTQVHYKESIEPYQNLSELWKDVFLYHWKEESQHAIMDEMEWVREDQKLSDKERNKAVDDFIELVGAVDGILQLQAGHDAHYFVANSDRSFRDDEADKIRQGILKAYRWQYIISGVQVPRFSQILKSLITEEQGVRITNALATII